MTLVPEHGSSVCVSVSMGEELVYKEIQRGIKLSL